jgi:aspartyl-tRNA(Asn)/glutamyl-tRNA(Gln) amidotransferase subunit B
MYSRRGFQPVIGLEIHAQLKTQTKIFSSEATHFDSGDNENVGVVSLGMPGALPTINKKVIEYSVKTGLALGCEIKKRSVFSRKNYFYPDLPKGYQISQYDLPICENGKLSFRMPDGTFQTVEITRAHMEEDAGKSLHHGEYTLVNYNRSGIPLLEIVSAPVINTPEEAAEYAKAMRQILRYIDVCDGNLEEGSMRCDCNVSVRRTGETALGTKVEIKNINSFRFIEKAIEYEIERQIEAIERGEKIYQETRLWDPDKNRTFSMRKKEDAQDYRYFPDPDLLPVILDPTYIQKIKSILPELPIDKFKRFLSEHLLSDYDALVFTGEMELAHYFEKTVEVCKNSKAASNWILSELMRELNENKVNVINSPIKAENLGILIQLIDQKTISGKIAKNIFQEMWKTGSEPEKLLKDMGLVQISDEHSISRIIDEVIKNNPNQVNDYLNGKEKLFGFFVGAAMKLSKGQANPDLVNKLLIEKLKNS